MADPTPPDTLAYLLGSLYEATAQAMADAAYNATAAQQQSTVTGQASTTQAVATLYALDTATAGDATKQIYQ